LSLDYARLEVETNPRQALGKLDQAIEGLNGIIRDIRTYIMDLRPFQLRGENLMDSLQRLIENTRANTRLKISLNGPDNGSLVLPAAISTALFHISQEALANIAKHAVAHQAKISLWQADRRVLLEITDDGVGFDTSKVSLVLGHGLANMRTRARKMGGDIEVVSEPGKGTSVLTWIPLEQNGHADQPQQSKD
jgi:two-component system sensor histidine kinase DevS